MLLIFQYALVIPLKGKKGTTITNAFQNFVIESNPKPNKITVDKGSEFDNGSIKSFLQNDDIEMYSKHDEGKSVVTERFIRTSKNSIYKYMNSISKNVYIDNFYNIDKNTIIHIISQ